MSEMENCHKLIPYSIFISHGDVENSRGFKRRPRISVMRPARTLSDGQLAVSGPPLAVTCCSYEVGLFAAGEYRGGQSVQQVMLHKC